MTERVSHPVIGALTWTRDRLARGLLVVGVAPNHLTIAGMVLTMAAGTCLAVGLGLGDSDRPPPWAGPGQSANWWLWLAAALVVCAGAMDVLDGAVARIGNRVSEFGAFLDSTLDRFSDIALFAGIAAGFAWRGNFTYTLLAVVAMAHAVLISYVRARAEDLIAHCKVGYWERGERVAALLIAAACYQVPAVLWQLATLPLLTALRRIGYTLRVTAHRRRTGEDLSASQVKPIGGGLFRLAPWRYPRGTLPWDLVTAANILWIVLAPISGAHDPIRAWIRALAG